MTTPSGTAAAANVVVVRPTEVSIPMNPLSVMFTVTFEAPGRVGETCDDGARDAPDGQARTGARVGDDDVGTVGTALGDALGREYRGDAEGRDAAGAAEGREAVDTSDGRPVLSEGGGDFEGLAEGTAVDCATTGIEEGIIVPGRLDGDDDGMSVASPNSVRDGDAEGIEVS